MTWDDDDLYSCMITSMSYKVLMDICGGSVPGMIVAAPVEG